MIKLAIALLLAPALADAQTRRAVMENVAASGNTIYISTGDVRVGIGTASPAYRLDVAGDIRSTGTIYGALGSTVVASSVAVNSVYPAAVQVGVYDAITITKYDTAIATTGARIEAVAVSTGVLTQDLATEVSDRQIADAAIAVSTGTNAAAIADLELSTGAIEAAKVNRAGDTMTGNLTLNSGSNTRHVYGYIDSTQRYDLTTGQTGIGGAALTLYDWNPAARILLSAYPTEHGHNRIGHALSLGKITAPTHTLDVSGGGVFSSSVTVGAGFYGSGAGLTSLPAGELVGTVPTGSVDLSTVTANHVLKTGDTMTGALIIQSGDLQVGGTSGSLLTWRDTYLASLSASKVLVGGGASNTHKVNVDGGAVFTSSITASAFYGDGSNLTGVIQSTATGYYPLWVATATYALNGGGGGVVDSTAVIDGLPIGSIIQYSTTTAPDGYLYCDGSYVSTTTYSQLFAVTGHRYSTYTVTGSPAVFQLPDFRGMFARGALGNLNGSDPDVNRVVGSTQTDTLQGHIHYTAVVSNFGARYGEVADEPAGNAGQFASAPYSAYAGKSSVGKNDGTNGTPRISTETRPKNVAVAYMIKYGHVGTVAISSSSLLIGGDNTFTGANTFTGSVTGAGFQNFVTFTSSGANTWTVPSGVTKIKAVITAGGGGGAASQGFYYIAGSGGGGGATCVFIATTTPGGSVSFSIGAGGVGGVGVLGSGSLGGNTTFYSIIAGGGGGATYYADNAPSTPGLGGACSGSVSESYYGASGQIALVSNGYAPGAVGGASGRGVGRGGRGVYNAAGEAGIFGGGGGGGSRTAGDSNGGAGGNGVVTIWY